MDGFKRRLRESVQLRLSFGVCVAILITAIATGAIAFFSALDEAHELQDSSLSQIAELSKNGVIAARPANLVSPPIHDEESSRVIVHFMFANTVSDPVDERHFVLPWSLDDGFYTRKVGEHVYRILVSTLSPTSKVAVAQRVSVRDEVAMASAWRTLAPFFILMPVLLIVVADLVKKIFKPIRTLAGEVNQRTEQDLSPLDIHQLPREIRPFIDAINQLLARTVATLEGQRRFIADAAHELRTPLTALTLQAERLSTVPLLPDAHQRVEQLRLGMLRTKNLLEQLLAQARAQLAQPDTGEMHPVNVNDIMRHVIEDLLPLAEQKSMDIGMLPSATITVKYASVDLFTVIKNLTDNAIRYTPSGGRIDLQLIEKGDAFIIEVEDNGPGISPEKRQRVLDAFYRIEGSGAPGSGLGLSIVKTIVSRLNGDMVLTDARRSPTGLNVQVTLKQV